MPNQEQRRREQARKQQAARTKAARERDQQQGCQSQVTPSPQFQAQQQPGQAQAAGHRQDQLRQQQLAQCTPGADYQIKLLPALEELRKYDLVSEQEAQEMRKLHISGQETARPDSVTALLQRLQTYISDPATTSKQVRQVRRLRGVIMYHQDMQAKYRDQERREAERREVERRQQQRQDRPNQMRPSTGGMSSGSTDPPREFRDLCERVLTSLLREVRSLGVMPVPKEAAENVALPVTSTSFHWLIEHVERKLQDYENASPRSELRTSKTRTARNLVADLTRLVDERPNDCLTSPPVVRDLMTRRWDISSLNLPAIQRDINRQNTTEFRGDDLGQLVDSFQKLELVSPEEARRFPRPINSSDWRRTLFELMIRLSLWKNGLQRSGIFRHSLYGILQKRIEGLAQDHDVNLPV